MAALVRRWWAALRRWPDPLPATWPKPRQIRTGAVESRIYDDHRGRVLAAWWACYESSLLDKARTGK